MFISYLSGLYFEFNIFLPRWLGVGEREREEEQRDAQRERESTIQNENNTFNIGQFFDNQDEYC